MSTTYAQFAARIIDLLKEADTSVITDRIIAVSKLRACANSYMGDIKPTGESEFGAAMSQAKGSAKKPRRESGQLF